MSIIQGIDPEFVSTHYRPKLEPGLDLRQMFGGHINQGSQVRIAFLRRFSDKRSGPRTTLGPHVRCQKKSRCGKEILLDATAYSYDETKTECREEESEGVMSEQTKSVDRSGEVFILAGDNPEYTKARRKLGLMPPNAYWLAGPSLLAGTHCPKVYRYGSWKTLPRISEIEGVMRAVDAEVVDVT